MTYKNIYAAVNSVKPCRFTARHGIVKFELIETPEDGELVNDVVRALRKLPVSFHHGTTKTYKFGENTQFRTAFTVEKA